MRLLYLYPEEWTGFRAREVHTLSTCVALAQAGVDVTLVTAGGRRELQRQLREIAGRDAEPGLELVTLWRAIGPIRSALIFRGNFQSWLGKQKEFEATFVIHLKAAEMLRQLEMPYLYEAHEVFAETARRNWAQQEKLHELEKRVLEDATWRVATSKALASALRAHFVLPDDFAIVPNAGMPPLPLSIGSPGGPFVYCGSLADWKGLDLVVQASAAVRVPLKIVGGTAEEWKAFGQHVNTAHVAWEPRVELAKLPEAFAGARAGVISTQTGTPSGRYSCPMKLFDYARCGLPVISSALPSLQSLNVGSWCLQVEKPTPEAWADALRDFVFRPVQAETARAWAGVHTWKQRGESLMRVLLQLPRPGRHH